MSETNEITSKIYIIGDFYGGADAYQWILFRRMMREKKDGANKGSKYEDYEICGYYATFASMCRGALRRLLLDGVSGGELKNLKEVIRKSEEIEREIRDAIGDRF